MQPPQRVEGIGADEGSGLRTQCHQWEWPGDQKWKGSSDQQLEGQAQDSRCLGEGGAPGKPGKYPERAGLHSDPPAGTAFGWLVDACAYMCTYVYVCTRTSPLLRKLETESLQEAVKTKHNLTSMSASWVESQCFCHASRPHRSL